MRMFILGLSLAGLRKLALHGESAKVIIILDYSIKMNYFILSFVVILCKLRFLSIHRI